jgi:XTP/dITP diphosphohydrolase
MTRRIVLASGNAGKVREFSRILAGSGIECVTQNEFGVPDAVEDGLSFVENALKKARNACRHTGLPAIADDSGLEVDALDGRPGIYSARFAGEGAGDRANTERLLEELSGVADTRRGARFVCVIVYLRHAEDPVPLICTGTWSGHILHAPRGDNGFGYDPVFGVDGDHRSSAELAPEEKNAISHRARALACFVEAMRAETAR